MQEIQIQIILILVLFRSTPIPNSGKHSGNRGSQDADWDSENNSRRDANAQYTPDEDYPYGPDNVYPQPMAYGGRVTNPTSQWNGHVPNGNVSKGLHHHPTKSKNITGTWPKRPPTRMSFNDRLNGPFTKSAGYLNR